MPAESASSWTIEYSSGASACDSSRAPYMRRTMRSENHQEPMFIAPAMTSARTRP